MKINFKILLISNGRAGSDCLVASPCSCFLVSTLLQDSPMHELNNQRTCRDKQHDLGGYCRLSGGT